MIARTILAKYYLTMPSKNRVKEYADQSVYHIYNRGNNKDLIFIDEQDYAVFMNLLKRHLSEQPTNDELGRPYKNFNEMIDLLAFCLMPNHFHLLIYQEEAGSMTQLMRSVATSYTGYFNKRHGRIGRLYQDVFKASLVNEEDYWLHISRYIHLNPINWQTWEWSSLPYYLGNKQASWVKPSLVLDSFFDTSEYYDFLCDYESYKEMLDELKYVTAD